MAPKNEQNEAQKPAAPANVPATAAAADELRVPDPEQAAQAQADLAEDGDALVALTSTGPVRAPRGLIPDPEPGHKGQEVYDPNAARRAAEGRGPGLQDSEVANPAHWSQADVQPDPPALQAARVAALRDELAGLERRAEGEKTDRVSAVREQLAQAEKAAAS